MAISVLQPLAIAWAQAFATEKLFVKAPDECLQVRLTERSRNGLPTDLFFGNPSIEGQDLSFPGNVMFVHDVAANMGNGGKEVSVAAEGSVYFLDSFNWRLGEIGVGMTVLAKENIVAASCGPEVTLNAGNHIYAGPGILPLSVVRSVADCAKQQGLLGHKNFDMASGTSGYCKKCHYADDPFYGLGVDCDVKAKGKVFASVAGPGCKVVELSRFLIVGPDMAKEWKSNVTRHLGWDDALDQPRLDRLF